MTLRPQAHDIIRTWAFYTITRGIYQEQTVPWENIMVSGFVLDPKGNKMSKSKGNVIAPQDVMDKYGADALRYWAAGSKLGDDLPYMEKDVQTGQKTVTKLWNASKLVLQQLEGYDGTRPERLETADRWLLAELQRTIGEATVAYESYEYAKAKAAVDLFFWNTFCDYYLELVKDRLYNPQVRGEEAKQSAQFTLSTALLTLLKMFAPLMPFITEEIHDYAFAKKAGESIHLARWPEVDPMLSDEDARRAGALLIDALSQVRRAKSEAKASLKIAVEDLAIACTMEEGQLLRYVEEDLKAAANATKVTYTTHEGGEGKPLRVTATLAAPAPVPTSTP
jgi:valyl-tRNA synthetase